VIRVPRLDLNSIVGAYFEKGPSSDFLTMETETLQITRRNRVELSGEKIHFISKVAVILFCVVRHRL